jgi:hypothetical protein
VRSAWLLALSMVAATTGCYSYHAVNPSDAVLDTRVRATVSAEKAAELATALNNVTPVIMGTLVERDGQTLMLEVPLLGTGVDGADPLHTRVRITPADLVTLESRTLSKLRTGIVLGAVVAAVGTGLTVFNGSSRAVDKPGTGVDNARILRPIFSVPLGRR